MEQNGLKNSRTSKLSMLPDFMVIVKIGSLECECGYS